jgi:hypothetical protein
LRACRAADADTSIGPRAATDANDEPSPGAQTRCPTGYEEVSGPVRPGTSDRLDDSSAGPPADGAPRTRDGKTSSSTSFAASDRQRNTTNPRRCRNSQ